jgi:glutamine amidotransferase
MIAIVDYGLGNIQAIANIYNRLNVPVCFAGNAAELSRAERIILPGVGSFDWAMTRLEQSGMRPALEKLVLSDNKPLLGICVGMQMLARRSEEGVLPGLGWIPGNVKRFDDSKFSDPTQLPQMGWNDVAPRSAGCLFQGLDTDARFYFLHSYYFAPQSDGSVLAETDYGGIYASSVRCGNVFGVQFHPEKSHQWGIRLLKNFSEI